MGAVRRVGVILMAVLICSFAWAGTLTVKASDAMAPAGGAHVEVQPAGVTGTTNADGKWSGAVPAGDQRVIVWMNVGGVLRGGIENITMPAGDHDVAVVLVDAIWIKDYYPLAVGNKWQYEYRHTEADGTAWRKTWRDEVDRSVMMGGDRAVVLAASLDHVPEWEEIRACNTGGFTMYTQQEGADTIKFDPPLHMGPLLPMGYEWVATGIAHHSGGAPDATMVFRCKFERFQTVRVPARLFTDCARLQVQFEAGPETNDITVWMAEGIGIVREIEKNEERRNEKLLEEYSLRGVPIRPLRPMRPIGPMTPKMP